MKYLAWILVLAFPIYWSVRYIANRELVLSPDTITIVFSWLLVGLFAGRLLDVFFLIVLFPAAWFIPAFFAESDWVKDRTGYRWYLSRSLLVLAPLLGAALYYSRS